MSQATRWDVTGCFCVELAAVDGHTYDEQDRDVTKVIDLDGYGTCWAEVVVEFRSRGSHLERSMYGGPDGLGWPEEHDDERTLIEAYINQDDDGQRVELPKSVQEALFDHYSDSIYETDLESGDDWE